MKITAEQFLMAKYGFEIKADLTIYDPKESGEVFYSGDLHTLMYEFMYLCRAENISINQHPRTKKYIIIDKDRDIVIGSFNQKI